MGFRSKRVSIVVSSMLLLAGTFVIGAQNPASAATARSRSCTVSMPFGFSDYTATANGVANSNKTAHVDTISASRSGILGGLVSVGARETVNGSDVYKNSWAASGSSFSHDWPHKTDYEQISMVFTVTALIHTGTGGDLQGVGHCTAVFY